MCITYLFYPNTIETAGMWLHMAIDLTQEIDRHSTTVTEDTYVTTYLFQRLSVSLQFPSEILHLPSNTPLQLLTFFIFNI